MGVITKKCYAVAILWFLLISLYSCKKSDSIHYANDVYSFNGARVKVIHASPQTTALDIGFDNDRLLLNYFAYTSYTNYLPITLGANIFSIYKTGYSNSIFSKSINFENKYYSVFIIDTASKMDVAVLQDNNTPPGKDSVRIRFANMSPDAGSLDFYMQGIDVPTATNINFKTATEFMTLKSGNVVFEIKKSGQNTLVSSSVNLNLTAGNFYTIWAGGFQSLTTDIGKLRVESIIH